MEALIGLIMAINQRLPEVVDNGYHFKNTVVWTDYAHTDTVVFATSPFNVEQA